MLRGADRRRTWRNAAFPFMTCAGDHRRRRAGARAAGDVRRRARLGAVLPRPSTARRCGGRCGTRAASTGWSPAATARSTACGWRRATASGAPTSPAETTPYEAGLGFCVKLDKPGGFRGRDALSQAGRRARPGGWRCLMLDDPRRGGARQRAGPGRRRGRRPGHLRRLRLHRRRARSPTRYLPDGVATVGHARSRSTCSASWVAGAGDGRSRWSTRPAPGCAPTADLLSDPESPSACALA